MVRRKKMGYDSSPARSINVASIVVVATSDQGDVQHEVVRIMLRSGTMGNYRFCTSGATKCQFISSHLNGTLDHSRPLTVFFL